MVAQCLQVLLALSVLSAVAAIVAKSNQSVIELLVPHDESFRNILSLDQINKIMLTEITEEFGGQRRLTEKESNILWSKAMEYEWLVAEEREANAHDPNGRRTQDGEAGGSSPFVVCDMHFGKTGESCKETVQVSLGIHLIVSEINLSFCLRFHLLSNLPFSYLYQPLYNKEDMTCFIVVALPSNIKGLPSGLAGIPMMAEMKMAAGLADYILTAEPMLSRVEALFCSMETESPSRATVLATAFLDGMINDGAGRRLRANAFLESQVTRDSHREEFWHRQLQDSDDDLCNDMLASLKLEVSPKGNTMMLTLPPDQRNDEFRECLHALVVDLVMQTEICYVGAYQQIETLNKLATGIVQSGSSTSTPFYDVGLDGLGQVVALSDTGIDTDSCYFWDSRKEILKDKSGIFNLDIRKVVQYVALGDDKENGGGHGSHVAGTIAGRRATDGKVESDGDGDGVARAAKLAFFDIGDCKTHETPLLYRTIAPLYLTFVLMSSSR
jgi:hypothetical protein